MTVFREGDLVNLTLENVRITQIHRGTDDLPEMTIYLDCEIGGQPIRIPHHWPMVTVEHVAPAEWPPRAGDLWRTERQPYFAVDYGNGDVILLNLGGEKLSPDFVLSHGSMTLVHREGQS